MKLCVIFPCYPPNYQIGGIEDYTKILVERFRKMGIDTYVITSGRYTGDDKKVFTIGDIEWGFSELRAAINIIKKENFDMVLMQYTPVSYGFGISFKLLPLCLKFLRKTPFFITTFHTLVGGKWISKISALLLTFFSHKVISTNEELTFLFNKYFWVFKNKLEQIPIGSNIEYFGIDKIKARDDIAQEFKIEKESTWLSNFGFTIPNKGIEDLFESVAKLIDDDKKYHLFMISALREGDEGYRQELMKLSETLKIDKNISWINESSDRNVSKFLSASDVFVVPYKDGICARRGTLMAGIAHHLPIVSTHSRVATPYFKNEENVLLVEPGNPRELAGAIDRMACDENLRSKIVRNIVKTEKYFDWDEIAHKIIRIYGQGSKSLREKIRFSVKIFIESIEYFVWLFVGIRNVSKSADITQCNPKKILILQLNSIGDVFMSTPALKSLRYRFSESQIDILTLPHTAQLLQENPNINHIYFCNNQFWRLFPIKWKLFIQHFNNLKKIKASNYDLCIDFGGTFESVVISTFLKIPLSIGFYREFKKGVFKNDTSQFYSKTVPLTEKHIVKNNLQLLKELGCESPRGDEEFFINDEDKERGCDFLSRYGLGAYKFAVIHPGAKWPPKRWPAQHFTELIEMLSTKMNMKTILVGGLEDKILLEQIGKNSNVTPIISCADLSLASLGAVLKMAGVFVGNDSGISHIAASVGAATIVLFGPTDPDVCLPQAEKVVYLRKNISCWPCTLYYRRNNCEMGDNICLHNLKPGEVIEAIKSLCV